MGAGGMFIPTSVIVQEHFASRRALAAGIASSGLSIGSLISTPVVHQLNAFYGWRGGLVIVSAFTVQSIAAAVLFFPVQKISPIPEEIDKVSGSERPSILQRAARTFGLHLLSNRLLVLFLAASFPLECGIDIYIYLGITRAIDEGVSPTEASFINSALGLSSFCGRLLSGFVGSAKGVNRSLYFGFSSICAGILVCLSVLAGPVFALHLTFTAAFGLFFGKYDAL
jgi:predicted MFS family arabinose efflux permease